MGAAPEEGATHANALSPLALRVAAREFGVTPARAAAVARDGCERLTAAIDGAVHEVALLAGDVPILAQLRETLQGSVRETRDRLVPPQRVRGDG